MRFSTPHVVVGRYRGDHHWHYWTARGKGFSQPTILAVVSFPGQVSTCARCGECFVQSGFGNLTAMVLEPATRNR